MDPFEEAFEHIGDDFELLMPTKPITIESVNPDTGEVIVTAEDVPALKRSRRRFPVSVGGGEVGADQCRFVFKASRIDAVMKERDRVTDSEGILWVIDERGATLIAFNQLWTVDVTRKR